MSQTKTVRYRLKLRNLDLPQKLLVGVIVSTILSGYLAALANVFAQHSEADGRSTIRLEEFVSVLRDEGPVALARRIEQSLGIDDVVHHYRGTGKPTRFQGSLDGTMRSMIEGKLIQERGDSKEVRDEAEAIRGMLVEWSQLPELERKAAYETGSVVNDAGLADFHPQKKPTSDELTTVVKNALNDYCIRCHKLNGADPVAMKYPLEDYKQLSVYFSPDTGVSLRTLALTTHVHLLGFSVLFALTGFLFSMTESPWILRLVFVPLTLSAQLVEIACWWLSKVDVVFAKMIFFIGPVVGISLLVQSLGVLLDLLIRRSESVGGVDDPPVGGGRRSIVYKQ